MPSDDRKSLSELARENRTQLGDPVSLKAETSNTEPTEHDRPSTEGRSLKQVAQQKLNTNPSQLGDPVSLKAETSDTEPTEHDRGALGGKTNGKPKL